MHIILVGASHGWRIYGSLKAASGYGITYTVTCLCVRGAKFSDLIWPKTVQKDEILIVIPFGNDLIARKYVKFDKRTRVIHLEKFIPYPKTYWEDLLEKLAAKVLDRSCRVLVIDNFYRHFCCDAHRHKGWLSYQTSVNKKIREKFQNTSIEIIDHRQLLDAPRFYKKNILEYRRLQQDSVHFRDYSPIAKNLLKMLL
jgi:hypothetical protein